MEIKLTFHSADSTLKIFWKVKQDNFAGLTSIKGQRSYQIIDISFLRVSDSTCYGGIPF